MVVRSYKEFVDYIVKRGLPKLISFDHDLADAHYEQCNGDFINYDELEEKTGYHCAKWLVNYGMDNGYIQLPDFMIHSMNDVGGKNIYSLLFNYEKHRND